MLEFEFSPCTPRAADSATKAAVERARRRESIELAAMQAYEERLHKQEEEKRKKSAGASRPTCVIFVTKTLMILPCSHRRPRAGGGGAAQPPAQHAGEAAAGVQVIYGFDCEL